MYSAFTLTADFCPCDVIFMNTRTQHTVKQLEGSQSLISTTTLSSVSSQRAVTYFSVMLVIHVYHAW